MKKQVTKLTFSLALISSLGLQSQQLQNCNTYAAMEQHFAEDPQAKIRFEAAQTDLLKRSEEMTNTGAKGAALVYTVPVVFHVLYDCGMNAVPDMDMINALKQVNDDYARMSFDTSLIFAPFKSSYIP